MLTATRFSEARSRLSRLFDEVVEEFRPVLIQRRGREALLLRRENLETLLEPFTLRANVLDEGDGSVTIAIDELDWAVNAPSRDAAVAELVADLRQYAEDYIERAQVFLRAPNRRAHFPYVLRVLLASTDEQVRRIVRL